jgi:hypothetical protein
MLSGALIQANKMNQLIHQLAKDALNSWSTSLFSCHPRQKIAHPSGSHWSISTTAPLARPHCLMVTQTKAMMCCWKRTPTSVGLGLHHEEDELDAQAGPPPLLVLYLAEWCPHHPARWADWLLHCRVIEGRSHMLPCADHGKGWVRACDSNARPSFLFLVIMPDGSVCLDKWTNALNQALPLENSMLVELIRTLHLWSHFSLLPLSTTWSSTSSNVRT